MRLGERQCPVISDDRPVGLKGLVSREPGGSRRKEIPPVEGMTRRLPSKLPLIDLAHFDRLFVVEYRGEHAIVRRQEKIPCAFNYNRPPGTPDAGIDDHDMNGAGRKLTIAGLEEIAGFVDSVRSDLMGEIDDASVWVNREDRTFHGGDEPIAVAEIRQERNESQRVRHASPYVLGKRRIFRRMLKMAVQQGRSE